MGIRDRESYRIYYKKGAQVKEFEDYNLSKAILHSPKIVTSNQVRKYSRYSRSLFVEIPKKVVNRLKVKSNKKDIEVTIKRVDLLEDNEDNDVEQSESEDETDSLKRTFKNDMSSYEFDILEVLINSSEPMTMKEISGETGMTWATANKYLNKHIEKNRVKKIGGRPIRYEFNKKKWSENE